MKNVELTERAAAKIDALRADQEERELTKSMIADAFATLAELIQYSKNKGSDLPQFVDEILDVMHTLGRYNNLINYLSDSNEYTLGTYQLTREGGQL